MGIHSAKQILGGLKFESADSLADFTNAKIKLAVSSKTADYQVTIADSGTIFNNQADSGAIIFTLPVPIDAGLFYLFVNSEDQDMTVAAAANTLLAFNDVTATSVKFGTSSQKAGNAFFVYSDGTQWHAIAWGSGTVTVA